MSAYLGYKCAALLKGSPDIETTVFSMILPRILHTTVLGLSFRKSNFWTHQMCRRNTALTPIR